MAPLCESANVFGSRALTTSIMYWFHQVNDRSTMAPALRMRAARTPSVIGAAGSTSSRHSITITAGSSGRQSK